MGVVHNTTKELDWDSDFCTRLTAIKIPLFFGSDYLHARKIFLTSYLIEPPAIQLESLKCNDKAVEFVILKLEEDVLQSHAMPLAVRGAYADKIHELRTRLRLFRLMRDVVIGKNNDSSEICDVIEQLYGTPSVDVFNQVRSQIYLQYLKQSYPAIKSYHYQNLASLFKDIPSTKIPEMTQIESISSADDIELITSIKSVKVAVAMSLNKANIYDWKVITNHNPYGSFKVLPREKKILIPNEQILRARKGERSLTKKRLQALIAHEVMTHVVRCVNGGQTPFKLLQFGLAGYLPGEEGIALLREQEVMGATDYASQNIFFALGVAYGLDRDGQKRTFMETFKILHDYFYVIKGLSGINSKYKAYATTYRLYRASTGTGTAVVMTKDCAYRQGNIAIHALLKKNPERKQWFDIGKFDPTNEHHVDIMRALDLIEG